MRVMCKHASRIHTCKFEAGLSKAGTHLFLSPSTFSTEYAGFSSFLTSNLPARKASVLTICDIAAACVLLKC